MAHIHVIHDPVGETLTVYFGEPRPGQICGDTGEGILLIKEPQSGEVIGFERLYYKAEPGPFTVTVASLVGDKTGT
jgi:hypothetical protein